MNDEIKEILTNLEDVGFMYKRISLEEIDKILDYITNLQQENERLTDELNICMIERNNFLSRIEKAVEYIKEHNMIVVNKEYIPDGISTAYDYELMNILNGGSDE